MLTAVLICAGLLFAWFAAYSYLTAPRRTAPYQGRHGAPFADPADLSDPDGTGYVAQLRDAGRLPYVTDEADEPDEADNRNVPDVWDEDEADIGWWDQSAPRVGWTPLNAAELAALREKLHAALNSGAPPVVLPPGDDGADTTQTDLHAVATWGKTPAQLADELAAKYLTAEVP